MIQDTAHKGKVIISCAITGAIHTPSMTPHLPITPDQIATQAIAAAEAGAAILHLHARDPETGQPDQSPAKPKPRQTKALKDLPLSCPASSKAPTR